jgi:hypothetical protein
MLLWLEADAIIRQISEGRRSLDDFCRAFMGAVAREKVASFELSDVIRTLREMVDYDWEGFWTTAIACTTLRIRCDRNRDGVLGKSQHRGCRPAGPGRRLENACPWLPNASALVKNDRHCTITLEVEDRSTQPKVLENP